MKMQVDAKTAKDVVVHAFGADINTSDMTISESEINHEVKMFNDAVLFNVSIILARRDLDDCERWIYRVSCSDNATGNVLLKYVHPITNAVYNDQIRVDFETLPFAA